MSMRRVLIFNRFERFWHWTQAAAIFALLFTGFGIHGLHPLGDFETLVSVHVVAALYLMVLWVFAVFWHLTTGSWRHYVPTSQGLLRVARYYAFDIFTGADHPYRKHFWRKHNPMQALTYLALKLILFPLIWLTGLAYLGYGLWSQGAVTNAALEGVALVHTGAAFAMLVFIILHIYLLTTGHSFIGHVQPMINGYDEVELSPAEETYLQADEPGRIR